MNSIPTSPEEIFDVVDENDSVIGTERRSMVHHQHLMHRAVHVFVFNEAGQLYLQRRSKTKDSAPGRWVSSCSGHVDSGEDYDHAAIRELKEEIGLVDPQQLKRVFKEPPCRATGNEFVWVYTCQSEGPFVLDSEEVSDGKWVDMAELESWLNKRPRDFAWSFVHLWRAYKKFR